MTNLISFFLKNRLNCLINWLLNRNIILRCARYDSTKLWYITRFMNLIFYKSLFSFLIVFWSKIIYCLFIISCDFQIIYRLEHWYIFQVWIPHPPPQPPYLKLQNLSNLIYQIFFLIVIVTIFAKFFKLILKSTCWYSEK